MRHLKFVSEKVSKACFNFEAVAGYDQAVRDRELEGYSQFSIIETEEVFTHFSVENTVKKVDKSSRPASTSRMGQKLVGFALGSTLKKGV